MISLEFVALREVPSLDVTVTPALHSGGRPATGNSARIKDLGYTAATHIKMYGEHLKLVSDPVEEDGCTVVQVISGSNSTVRTLRLPVSILLGASNPSGHKTKFGKRLR